MSKLNVYDLYYKMLNKKFLKDTGKVSDIEIYSRRSTILPIHMLTGYRIKVYNGYKFNDVKVTEDMLGSKFGEYSPTRKRTTHKKDKKNKK